MNSIAEIIILSLFSYAGIIFAYATAYIAPDEAKKYSGIFRMSRRILGGALLIALLLCISRGCFPAVSIPTIISIAIITPVILIRNPLKALIILLALVPVLLAFSNRELYLGMASSAYLLLFLLASEISGSAVLSRRIREGYYEYKIEGLRESIKRIKRAY